jgi:hypothetical protein
VFLEKAVDKDVATADFAEEYALGAAVEEMGEIPGKAVGAVKDVAEDEVEEDCSSPSSIQSNK